MAGKSPVMATDAQSVVLKAMAAGADRVQTDRARAILLTVAGWISERIAEAFGVREDTVRLWRTDFMAGGVDVLATSVAAGPIPVKANAALRLAGPLFDAPVSNRPNWTLARLAEEIKAQEGVSISRSQLSKVLRKKENGDSASGGHVTR